MAGVFLVASVVTARTGFSSEAAEVALLSTLLFVVFRIGAASAMSRTVRTNLETS